jgi:hypothetical protein
MIDENETGCEIAEMIYFINKAPNAKPVVVTNEEIWPLGTVGGYCSFCCSAFNIKTHELRPGYGMSWCGEKSCKKRALTSLGHAYSMEMPLYMSAPINSHVLNEYDNITEGFITYIYFGENSMGDTTSASGEQDGDTLSADELYAHVEWQTKYYNDHKNIRMRDILSMPSNTSTNFVDIITQSCSKYTCYSYNKYNKYKKSLSILYMEQSVVNQMNSINL